MGKTLSALMVVRNEEDILKGCIDRTSDFVNEIIIVDMASRLPVRDYIKQTNKIKIFDYPYVEPVNMGEVRTFSLKQATGDWFLQIDADEYYPVESMQKIREVIETTDAYSIRVNYHNLAWRSGYKQVFEHYPDRLYRRDVVEKYHGVLPLDMTIVKEEFRNVKHKGKGIEGVLEYDNPDDRSFEHPRQPIRKDIFFYHLARARGHNYEYEKRKKYERFTHPTYPDWQIEQNVRMNQWVAGNYPMEKIDVPDDIPTKIIPNPKVSTIISCYNKAQWIGEAIESCLSQTYVPHEIIVIDDGSTDSSPEVIQRYNVKYISQSNRGVAMARNRGLGIATGDYFILLDGDDKLAPTYIEKTLQEMKGDIQVVYTDVQMIGEWDWEHKYSGNIEELRTAQCIPSTIALCDMRILDPYGNFKSEAIREDYEFWLNVYYNRKANFKHIPETLCYYRRGNNTRIDWMDAPERKETGFQQLRDWYKEFRVNPQ